MSTARDDDALRWDGDDDPTLDTGTPAAEAAPAPATREPASDAPAERALPDGFTAVGKGSDEVGRIADDGTVTMPGDPVPLSNGALVALGVLGGAYILFVIGWIVGGLRLQGEREYLVSDVMFQGSFWLAVLAPVIWFGTVFLLTRTSATWVRFAWLAAGLVLLVPWPFIMTGATGR